MRYVKGHGLETRNRIVVSRMVASTPILNRVKLW
jgi:hypothetical protein